MTFDVEQSGGTGCDEFFDRGGRFLNGDARLGIQKVGGALDKENGNCQVRQFAAFNNHDVALRVVYAGWHAGGLDDSFGLRRLDHGSGSGCRSRSWSGNFQDAGFHGESLPGDRRVEALACDCLCWDDGRAAFDNSFFNDDAPRFLRGGLEHHCGGQEYRVVNFHEIAFYKVGL